MSDKLIVGLGNPGEGYAGNRHNIGFMALDRLAAKHRASPWRKQHKGLACEYTQGGRTVTLLKPMTYMNLSGDSVVSAATMLEVPYNEVLVIHDELDLPFSTLRLKDTGGVGGHNGLKDIRRALGVDFSRLRVGVGRPTEGTIERYVLSDFTEEEQISLPLLLERAQAAVDMVVAVGFTNAMITVNTKIKEV